MVGSAGGRGWSCPCFPPHAVTAGGFKTPTKDCSLTKWGLNYLIKSPQLKHAGTNLRLVPKLGIVLLLYLKCSDE